MKVFHRELFNDLMKLQDNDAFYFVDQVVDGHTYRIFLYRLASYTDFLLPSALECRGHTFLLDSDGRMVKLVSLPMQKFHNYMECPFTMDLDLSTIDLVTNKLDGSLISTVQVPDGTFVLKTKGSFFSDQAIAATALLTTDKYTDVRYECMQLAVHEEFTVNFEYCAPTNRIVIGYPEPMLRVLNVRNNWTGEYLPYDTVCRLFGKEFVVESIVVDDDPYEWVNSVYKSKDNIESYVVRLSCGKMFKVKTSAYCVLHKTKDSVSVPRRLFEACVMQQADDLRGLFIGDTGAIALINEMEEKVFKIYNVLHKTLYAFYNENRHLGRKEYAIIGQEVLKNDGIFGLAMNLYLGKSVGLEDFMIKNYRKYGIKDIENEYQS